MLHSTPMTAVLAACFLALSGCAKSDCEKTCDAVKDCPQVPSIFASISCGDACDFEEDRAQAAGCTAEFDAYYACGVTSLDAACENGTCGAEAQTYYGCVDNLQ